MITLTKFQIGLTNKKKLFNPGITKQAQEFILSWRNTKIDHSAAYFNETPVAHALCQKHLRRIWMKGYILIITSRRKMPKQTKV